MKGLEKLTSIRLAEVLTQKGLVPAEPITEALYAQDKGGEPFVDTLVGGGHIAEWDLARVVVEAFQLPFLLASNYDIQEEVKLKVEKEQLFEANLVPVDLFGNVLTVVMPILTPFDKLHKIRKTHSIRLYPFVGLASENRKILTEMFPDYTEWQKKATELREKKARKPRKAGGGGSGLGDWTNIFDSADEAVRTGLPKRG